MDIHRAAAMANLSSAHIRLAVGATPNNTFYLSSLSLALPAFSQNLVANASAHDNNPAPPLDELTSTVLRINNKPHIPYIAPTTRIIKSSPSLLLVRGLVIRPAKTRLGNISHIAVPSSDAVAYEDWTFALGPTGRTFSWAVNRTFLRPAAVTADRHGLVLSTRRYGAQQYGALGSQVPSQLDLGMKMNMSGGHGGCGVYPGRPAGTCGPHGFASASDGWFSFTSAKLHQRILLTPSAVEIDASFAGDCARFSIERQESDGTVLRIGVGCRIDAPDTGSDTEAGTRRVEAGATESTMLRVSLDSGDDENSRGGSPAGNSQAAGSPYATLSVNLPRLQPLADSLQLFSRVQHQWLSWIFGNNPGRRDWPSCFEPRRRSDSSPSALTSSSHCHLCSLDALLA